MKIENIYFSDGSTFIVPAFFQEYNFPSIHLIACAIMQYIYQYSQPSIWSVTAILDNGHVLCVNKDRYTVFINKEFTPEDKQKTVHYYGSNNAHI